MLENILDNFTKNNIKSDVIQFGLALTLSHIFAGKNFQNIKSIFLTLLGFITFHILVEKIVNVKNLNPQARITLEDTLKFATMLIVSKFFINKEKIKTANFLLSGVHLLLGFFVYNTLILKNYTYKLIKPDMNLNKILAINDISKFGFVLIFAGILDSLMNKESIDFEYLRLTVGYVTGLVIYDLYII